MLIKVLPIVFPVLLFIFKYLLPSLAEDAFSNKKRVRGQIAIELIHFPVDLLFVAIGYTIPQIIDISMRIYEVEITKDIADIYLEMISRALYYGATSIVIILFVPFFVFLTKFAENNYFRKRKRWFAQTAACYFIAGIFIWISIFRH